MNVIEKIAYYQQVWKVSLPHLPTPLPKDIRYWAEIDPQIVEATILQASNRFAANRIGEQFDVTQVYRWVTGTARNRIRRAQEVATLQNPAPVSVPVTELEEVNGNR
jgi:hypothetical protein